MLSAFSSLSPKDEVIWYFALLFAIYSAIYFVDHYLLKTHQTVVRSTKSARQFFYDVGFSLLGIFRGLTGAVPTALAILIVKNGLNGATQSILFSTIFVSTSLFACCGLSYFQSRSKLREKFP